MLKLEQMDSVSVDAATAEQIDQPAGQRKLADPEGRTVGVVISPEAYRIYWELAHDRAHAELSATERPAAERPVDRAEAATVQSGPARFTGGTFEHLAAQARAMRDDFERRRREAA